MSRLNYIKIHDETGFIKILEMQLKNTIKKCNSKFKLNCIRKII